MQIARQNLMAHTYDWIYESHNTCGASVQTNWLFGSCDSCAGHNIHASNSTDINNGFENRICVCLRKQQPDRISSHIKFALNENLIATGMLLDDC